MENSTPNYELANLVRGRRKELRMTQEQLAEAMGKTRSWTGRVEKGVRHDRDTPIELDAENALKLAAVLGLDEVRVLQAGRVPRSQWPNLSNTRSNSGSVRVIDVTSLTSEQQDIIERVVDEFKHLNHESKHP